MSQSTKEMKKALKGPDFLQRHFVQSYGWMENNKTLLLLALAATVGTIAAIAGANYYLEQAEEKERNALAAIDMMHQEVAMTWSKSQEDAQRRLVELQLKIQSEKKGTPALAALTAEKDTLEKQLQGTPDYTKAAGDYLKYFEANKTKPTGWIAGLRASDNLLEKKEYAKARDILQVIVQNGAKNEFYNVQVRLMLASVQEQLGDYDAALQTLTALNSKNEKSLEPIVLLNKGRIYMFKSDNVNAKKLLDELVKNHPTADESRTARGMIALM